MTSVKYMGHVRMRSDADPSFLPERQSGDLWQAWRMPSGAVVVQALDSNKHPVGKLHSTSFTEFFENFTPQAGSTNSILNAHASNLLAHLCLEKMRSSQDSLEFVSLAKKGIPEAFTTNADYPVLYIPPVQNDVMFSQKSELFDSLIQGEQNLTQSAQFLDSQNPEVAVKATAQANAHLTFLEKNLRKQYRDIESSLETKTQKELVAPTIILLSDPAFDHPELQFLFTEFGLAFRRIKRYELSLLCHLKALEITPKNERVLFNLARTEYELGEILNAREYLNKALSFAPEFSVAKDFLTFLEGTEAC